MENQNKDQFPKKVSEQEDPSLKDSAASTNNTAGESGEGPSGIRGGGTDLSQGPGALGVMGNMSRSKDSEEQQSVDSNTSAGTNDPNGDSWSKHQEELQQIEINKKERVWEEGHQGTDY